MKISANTAGTVFEAFCRLYVSAGTAETPYTPAHVKETQKRFIIVIPVICYNKHITFVGQNRNM
jgi:hypothetical protein